jgi:hypothetical protein
MMFRVFDREKLNNQVDQRALTQAEFSRRLIKAAPKSIKPTQGYVLRVMNGTSRPSVDYVTLFMYVLNCQFEDLTSLVHSIDELRLQVEK